MRGQVTKIWHQKGNTYVLPRLNSNFVSSLIEKPLRQGLKPLQVWFERVSIAVCVMATLRTCVGVWLRMQMVQTVPLKCPTADVDESHAQVVQPEGPSFQVNGHNVVWQQWHLHVGFNFREGLVLSHIGCGPQFLVRRCTCEKSRQYFLEAAFPCSTPA